MTRACVTTVIVFQFGPTADARVNRPLEQIDTWLHTWTSTTATHRHDTRFTCQRHLTQHLTTGKSLISMGPSAALINAVLRAGWKSSRPDLWHVEEGTSICIDKSPFARFQTIARAQVDLQGQVWKHAALHEHGGGLETGIPSMQSARNAFRYLRKHCFFVQARAFEYIVVGFFQDPDESTPIQIAICARCAKGLKATRYHTTYECPDNLKHKYGIC